VNWVHRSGKEVENEGSDIDGRSIMKDLYDQWVDLGKPTVK
jgi:hypothetical protein